MNSMLLSRKAFTSAHVARNARPAAGVPPARPGRKLRLVALQAAQKPDIAKFADSIGLPTEEGLFGFKPFSEIWCGRLAMMGFITSIVVEFQTGKGTIQQLGIETPSNALLSAVTLAVLGGSIIGAGLTVYRGLNGKMSKQEAGRYKSFLLLENENDLIEETRKEGTVADKFLSPNNLTQIQDAKASGSPIDRFLGNDDIAQAAAEAKLEGTAADAVLSLSDAPTLSAAPTTSKAPKSYDDIWFPNYELKYARDVELSNGRSAMVGFLAAVLVEAATGKGILLQLIMWGKLSGLLGYESGF